MFFFSIEMLSFCFYFDWQKQQGIESEEEDEDEARARNRDMPPSESESDSESEGEEASACMCGISESTEILLIACQLIITLKFHFNFRKPRASFKHGPIITLGLYLTVMPNLCELLKICKTETHYKSFVI